MSALTGSPFDCVARQYDDLWSTTPAGRSQRESVWRVVDPLFHPGERILDVGCGTGVDALQLMSRGLAVEAIDGSAAMVEIARSKGVSAYHLPAEKLSSISTTYDGAISNFGVLNCVADLEGLSAGLAALIRPSGFLAVCVMGAFCLWETCYFLRSGQLRKAVRRWSARPISTSFGVRVHYPRIRALAKAFRREFRLLKWRGVGVAVPPSYVAGISPQLSARLTSLDRVISSWPLLRGTADHRLLVFARL